MAEYSIGPIDIQGHSNKPVPNRLFRNVGPANGLAILFPGLRYTCDMPLFFYPMKLMLQRGFDVLQLHTDYTSPVFSQSSPDRQIDWMGSDAWAAVEAASNQRSYDSCLLMGKSIGTLAQSVLLLEHPDLRSNPTIWLTPLFRLPLIEQATQQLNGPALYVAGTGDTTYDANRLDYLKHNNAAETLIFEDADHSLEIPGNLDESLVTLQKFVQGLADFIDRSVLA